jgi:hypothetical protein
LTRITREQSADVGKGIFKTFLARFCSGQVLEIARIAIQAIYGTHTFHVLTGNTIQTRCVARQILVLSCTTRCALF